jgi:hypothetical protein
MILPHVWPPKIKMLYSGIIKKLKHMTVKKLIDLLQDFDENMEVKFAYNFGDYWGTEVASNITEIDEGQVRHSDYHRMDKVVDDENDEEYYTKTVVIIK